MNILHLEASPGWGGQEIRILREAEGMRARGHQVVLGVMRGGGLIAAARDAGFTVYELNFRRVGWIQCLIQLLVIIKRHQINLINTHSSLDSWIGGIAARIAKKTIVRTRHLSSAIRAGWNSRILYGKLADFVVTTCNEIVPVICRQAKRDIASCRSIPTGVDREKIRFDKASADRFRTKLGVKEGEFLVGTACFMRSWKGIDDFLKAADLLRNVPGLKWVIIGGGHDALYRKRAHDLKLDEIVHFAGHLDSPFAGIGALDLFALLSTAHEGVSQAILQAAFLGKPLLATPTGGLREVCIDKLTGLLVPPFSSIQVAKAVLEFKENPALCKLYGENAKRLVEEKFTLKRTLDEMEEVYKIATSQ